MLRHPSDHTLRLQCHDTQEHFGKNTVSSGVLRISFNLLIKHFKKMAMYFLQH